MDLSTDAIHQHNNIPQIKPDIDDPSSDSDPEVVEKNEMIWPHSLLPKPEAPSGVYERSRSLPETVDAPATEVFGKFIREKSNSVSEAISRRFSSFLKEEDDAVVKEFNLIGVKVTKTFKDGKLELKGRISFFSRSNCRDCGAVRSFLRERDLNFVEINVDVYPGRLKELKERTGGASVPQIFFNEKLIGGLVALNSLRNSGMLDAKLGEILSRKCPDDAPSPPVYGLDEAEDSEMQADELAVIARVVRKTVPIQDRILKMKFVRNCFSSAELVDALLHHFDCGHSKAIEIGKQLARKHFIHHVFGENDFEDGNHLYRFLEHESFITKCHNFRGVVNDHEPKAAVAVSHRLHCLMSAILESYSYATQLDYVGISNSEEFRRYINLVEDLQRLNLFSLSHNEKLAFFLNVHNSMAMHGVIQVGGVIDRGSLSDFMYVIGGYFYSLSSIRNGILRNNRRPPFSLIKPFSSSDKRLQLAFPKVNELIHFGIWNGTRSSPSIRFFSPQGVESELKNAAREYFQREEIGMQVDLSKRTVYLPRLMKWYNADYGQEKEILKWIINYLDASKAGLLTHLLSDGGSVNIVYQNYDWSLDA